MAYWPDTGTGVDTQPARKPVQSAIRKYFTEGGIGQAPTVPGGDWFNQMTNEVLNVLAEAGIEPSKFDDDQLLQAILFIVGEQNLFAQSGPGTSTRPAEEKLREKVSLSDFSGFVGDGAADDTAAFISASVNTNLTRRTLTCTSDKTIRLVGNSQITFNREFR